MFDQEQQDCGAIERLIQRERMARDMRQWVEMARCYRADSVVEVSWFKGSGIEFAERSGKAGERKVNTFHLMCPAVVTVNGDKALADTPCTIHGLTELDGVHVDIVSHARLSWRARRTDDVWLLSGMRACYLSDAIVPRDPTRLPVIDHDLYETLRPSYRSIAYAMAHHGSPVPDDLPGIDRPDAVAALRAGERQWLDDETLDEPVVGTGSAARA